jgi:hypothetical protein
MDELLQRAFAAYFRSGATDQPSKSASGIETVAGLQYVVLRSARGVLAVYRVRNDGVLKGLKRWPAEFYDGGPDVDIINPLPRTNELLSLDRELTAAEKQEVANEIARVKLEVKRIDALVNEMRIAIRTAR